MELVFDGRFSWAHVDDPENPQGLPDHVPMMYGSIMPMVLEYQRIDYFLVEPRYVPIKNGDPPAVVVVNPFSGAEQDKLSWFYMIYLLKINPYLIPEKTLIGYLKPYNKKDALFYDGAPVSDKNKKLVDAFHKIKSVFMESWIDFEVTRIANTGFSLPVAISHLMLTDVYSNYYNILGDAAVDRIGVDDVMTGTPFDRGSVESRAVFKEYETRNARKYTAEWNFGYLEAMAAYWHSHPPEVCHAGSGMEWG
jgi:hypothetical protein